MNHDDTLWLAGLCEGEATFDMQKGRYPRVRVGMTDRDTVGRVATLFGCKVRLSLKRAPHAAMWHAEIQGPKAVAVMQAILPHMGARRSAKIAEILGHSGLPATAGPTIVRPPAYPMPGR